MLDKLVVKFMVLKMRLDDERGQDLVEYALLTGGIGLLLVLAVGVFSGAIGSWFGRAANTFNSINP